MGRASFRHYDRHRATGPEAERLEAVKAEEARAADAARIAEAERLEAVKAEEARAAAEEAAKAASDGESSTETTVNDDDAADQDASAVLPAQEASGEAESGDGARGGMAGQARGRARR